MLLSKPTCASHGPNPLPTFRTFSLSYLCSSPYNFPSPLPSSPSKMSNQPVHTTVCSSTLPPTVSSYWIKPIFTAFTNDWLHLSLTNPREIVLFPTSGYILVPQDDTATSRKKHVQRDKGLRLYPLPLKNPITPQLAHRQPCVKERKALFADECTARWTDDIYH